MERKITYMGYTKFTTDLVKRHLGGVNSVVDLGSSNLYINSSEKPPFVDSWYKQNGVTDYTCVDLAGDNNAIQVDVSSPISIGREFDLLVDSGFSEHVVQMTDYEVVPFHDGHINSIYPKGEIKSIEDGYYNCWLNKFNLCKIGGLIISENPLTENWPSHGYSYIDTNFYHELCKIAALELIECGTHAACGNVKDGWNVWGVVRKVGSSFPTKEDFYKYLPIFSE